MKKPSSKPGGRAPVSGLRPDKPVTPPAPKPVHQTKPVSRTPAAEPRSVAPTTKATPWKGSTMQPCSACQGSGKRIVHEVTGADVNYGPCPTCKGTGEVPKESQEPAAPGAGEEGSSPTSSPQHPPPDKGGEDPTAARAGTPTYGG